MDKMERESVLARLADLKEELEILEASRPAHSPSIDLELRVDEILDEISRLRSQLGN
jgi:hypothetical protein